MKRTITPDEYHRVVEGLYQLTDILLAVGVAELKISAKEELIFWDTQGKGQVDPALLESFFELIEGYFWQKLEIDARRRPGTEVIRSAPSAETIADRARRFNALLGPGPGREENT